MLIDDSCLIGWVIAARMAVMLFSDLPEYELIRGEIARSGPYQVSARRRADGRYVTIKSSSDRDGQLAREFQLLSQFDTTQIISAVSFSRHGDTSYLILDDPRIPPANERFRGPLAVSHVLALGRQVAVLLSLIHARDVVHLDISPYNILVDERERVTLAGFSVAHSFVNADRPIPTPIGDPRYMSPEQTGLMNHSVGIHSDLYCLGSTLYEWLTGESPFCGDGARELMHAQISRLPRALVEYGVPAPVSRCVGRLMAKNPAHRYPDAETLLADLDRCTRRLAHDGTLASPFRLGVDVAHTLEFPERLYGREDALEKLAMCLRRPPERVGFFWVQGYSGVGKSSVVAAVAALQNRPLWSGKCEQYRRNVPFASVNRAIAPWLVRRLHETSSSQVRLAELAGEALDTLVNAFPALRPFAPPTACASAVSGDAPLVQSAVRVVTALADQNHPLYVFLDDLQWADSATIRWLDGLSRSRHATGIAIVGAYRSESVDPMHPLATLRRGIKEADIPTLELILQPLTPDDVTALLADTLHLDRDDARPLARALHRRTHGNPFFLRQFCSFLVENRYLHRNSDGWQWNIDEVQQAPVSDDLIEFLLGELHRLPDDVQRCLQRAASIGHRFTFAELQTLVALPFVPVGSSLSYAAERKLVSRSSDAADTWQFVHDRIHQAAYRLVGEEERRLVHAEIGRNLMANGREGERVFDIVHHWNIACERLTTDEIWRLAKLDMHAAVESRRSGALDEALTYAHTGCRILPAHAWENARSLAFGLHYQWAQCARMMNDNAQCQRVIAIAESHAQGSIERALLITLQLRIAHAEGRTEDAIACIRQGLQVFGIPAPDNEDELSRQRQTIDRDLLRWAKHVNEASFASLSRIDDPVQAAVARFLENSTPSTYNVAPALHDYLIALQIQLGLRHGRSTAFIYGCISYAFDLVCKRHLYDCGIRLALLALEAGRADARPADLLRQQFVIGMMEHFTRPLDEVEQRFKWALEAGLHTGDLTFSSYTYSHLVILRLSRGDELTSLREQAREYRQFVDRTGVLSSQQVQQFNERLIACYQGHTREHASLNGPDFSESEFAASLHPNGFARSWYVAAKLQQLYRFGQHAAAMHWLASDARSRLDVTDVYLQCELIAFASLVLADARQRGALDDDWLPVSTRLRGYLARWSESCPDTFRALHLLSEAEWTADDRTQLTAMPLYQSAIEAAERAGMRSQAALANERAARYHERRGCHSLALHYAREAVALLRNWGAFALVDVIRSQFGELSDAGHAHALGRGHAHRTLIGHDLDIENVLRASQAMSAEVKLDGLLQKLINIAALGSGADVCGIYLLREEAFELAALRDADGDVRTWLGDRPRARADQVPLALLRHVVGSREPRIIGDLSTQTPDIGRAYFATHAPLSVAALPLFHRACCVGVLYLENRATANTFTVDRLRLLSLLSTQMAIAIDNAFTYEGLVAAQRAAEAASRAKDRFFATVSHELRTPLNGVLGGAQILMMDAHGQGVPVPDEVMMIVEAGYELSRLIEDMLDAARLDEQAVTFDISRFQLKPLLANVIDQIRRDTQIAISWRVAPDIGVLTSDKLKLRRILMAVIGNAVKFTPDGSVSIRASRHMREMEARIHIEVEDDGVGVAEHDLQRIFEPFEQADTSNTRRFGGPGLGLSISRRLCHALGGQLTVQSTLHRGSVFTIILPETVRVPRVIH